MKKYENCQENNFPPSGGDNGFRRFTRFCIGDRTHSVRNNKKELYQGTKSQKPSVREEIKAIKAEQKAKEDLASKKDKDKNTNKNKHKDKNSKSKNKKVKERGAK